MTRWISAAVVAATACSSQDSSATFAGTVHGDAMTPAAAISAAATVNFASGVTPAAVIVLTDAGALCTRVSANRDASGSRSLRIFLSDVDAASGVIKAPAGTGTFPVFIVGSGNPPPHFAVASFAVVDDACRNVAAKAASAVSGSVTLTGNERAAYAGTYDLTFDSGDRVTGAFQTAPCQGLAAYLAADAHGCG